MTPSCFLASVDLQNAYLHIQIANDGFQNLSCFLFKQDMYSMRTLIFGINLASRVFFKLHRPGMTELRKIDVNWLIYIDDILIIGLNLDITQWAVSLTAHFLTNLGFLISWEQSVITQRLEIEWLVVQLNSVKMSISLPGGEG